MLKKLASRVSILRELFQFLWRRKLWWMLPIVFIFILLGVLIIFTQSAAVVPFIYTLF